MKNGPCGARPGADPAFRAITCEFEVFHDGWHRCAATSWQNEIARRDPPITPEERKVIEAAKALRLAFPYKDWHVSRLAFPESERFCAAVDALPKPPPSLVERLRTFSKNVELAPSIQGGPSVLVEVLREAADELERLAK